MIRAAALATGAAAGPAWAEPSGAAAWLLDRSGASLTGIEVGTHDVRGTALIAVDSLTFSPGDDWPWLTAPEGPARVVAFHDPGQMALAQDAIARVMGGACNPYDCLMAGQVPADACAQMVRLPHDRAFPAFSTGYGDGVCPVFVLYDDRGAPVAAHADFLGLPPDCGRLTPPAFPQPAS